MMSSMTGFASAAGEQGGVSWSFEVKSVNGRGLDVRLYLPPGCEKLEAGIRGRFKPLFSRGNMQANLQVRDRQDSGQVSVDTRLLTGLSRRARILDRQNRVEGGTRAADLFALRGVLSGEKSARDISEDDQVGKAILKSVDTCLNDLKTARQSEGKALQAVMIRIVDDMEAETRKAYATAEIQPGEMLSRLKARMAAILGDSRVSEERLEQELAILVTKADVTEEIDRLSAHFVDCRKLLASKSAIGRKLDFLSQELLREANTLGSKAASLEMTRHSLALKGLIDQFKEQAANVE